MKKTIGMAGVLVGLFWANAALAEIIVTLGDQTLLPDTAGQEVAISVTGDERISGMILRLSVTGGAVITDVDLVDGTIFEPAPFPSASTILPASEGVFEIIILDPFDPTITDVEPNGLLATVTLSTEGVTSSDFAISLISPTEGPTQFANVAGLPVSDAEVILPGRGVLVPEPGGLMAWLALASLVSFASDGRRIRRVRC